MKTKVGMISCFEKVGMMFHDHSEHTHNNGPILKQYFIECSKHNMQEHSVRTSTDKFKRCPYQYGQVQKMSVPVRTSPKDVRTSTHKFKRNSLH
jgi:hypothetical protein